MSQAASSAPVRARVPTLRKTAELCGLFTTSRPRWRLQEICAELGWDPATAHRFLKALVEVRMLAVDADGGYTVGLLPVEMASVYLASEPRRRAFVRRCEEIAARTGLTCQLGILDGASVVIVTSHEGASALRAAAMLGERLPVHATSGGTAILSQLADDEIEALLPERLERLTPETLSSRAALIEQVREVRANGLAQANGELLKKYPTWVITIEGHCDERGTAEYNLALGERRAVAVQTYLVSLGIAPGRIRTVQKPMSPSRSSTSLTTS